MEAARPKWTSQIQTPKIIEQVELEAKTWSTLNSFHTEATSQGTELCFQIFCLQILWCCVFVYIFSGWNCLQMVTARLTIKTFSTITMFDKQCNILRLFCMQNSKLWQCYISTFVLNFVYLNLLNRFLSNTWTKCY